MAGGRRRTDVPGELWGAQGADARSAGPEVPQRIPRSRLPLPPVPASPGAPRTSAAPFRAVPAPELPGGPLGDGRIHGAAAALDHGVRLPGKGMAGNGLAGSGLATSLPRPARAWVDDEPALVSTGPGLTASGARAAGPAPRLPRQVTPAGTPSPAYGDWTKPSRSSEPMDLDFSADAAGQLGLRMPAVAPATTAIPERPISRGQSTDDERFDSAGVDAPEYDRVEYRSDRFERPGFDSAEYDRAGFDSAGFDSAGFDSAEFDAPLSEEQPARSASSGPGTNPGRGRAAMRAQRQAADMARRKAAKKSGEPVGLPDDEELTGRRPRRVLMGLVAMAVVALGVLGVYTVLSPGAEEAGSGTRATQSSTPAAGDTAPVLPPLQTEQLQVEVTSEAPAGPVFAPVTVLNATDINGLAARVSQTLVEGGWETPGVGTYLAEDIAVPTVFYTAGDETQRQAAESLKAQFPQLQATAERFFEVPADVAAPGLVIVLTGEWQP